MTKKYKWNEGIYYGWWHEYRSYVIEELDDCLTIQMKRARKRKETRDINPKSRYGES